MNMTHQPPLVDTHAHLDFHAFEDDRPAVLRRAQEAGVAAIILPAIDPVSAQRALMIAEALSTPRLQIYVAVGVHPNGVAQCGEGKRTLTQLRAWTRHPRVVAIGEIGLDYYREATPPQAQQEALRAQLDLAAEAGLPVILHQRASAQDLLVLLETWVRYLPPEHPRGVLHSFSAGPEEARRALDLGFAIGITGPVTFKKAETLRQVVAEVPLERLLIETDAPFLTPHPYRGKRNEPAYVRFVAEKIAQVKGVTYTRVAEVTTMHAWRRFRLPHPAPLSETSRSREG